MDGEVPLSFMSTHGEMHNHVHGNACSHTHSQGGRWADRIGVISTMACAIHCMFTPVYAILRSFEAPEWMHWVDWVVLPLSILGVLHLSRHFARTGWKMAVWGGWSVMASGTLLEHWYAPAWIAALVGACILFFAYIRHLRSGS